jgi:uncharacterized membrane protein YuzA (DUF378 family)
MMKPTLDAYSLLLVLGAGLLIGIRGLFNIDIAEYVLGDYVQWAYVLIGIAAIWQVNRQPMP